MAKLTIELSEDDFYWLKYRAEALGLPSADALIGQWIAADATDEARIETLRALLDAGKRSGISNRSMDEIFEEHRKRCAAA